MQYGFSSSSRRPASRRGVVMVEVAMAVLVLSIGVISVFVLFRGGFKRAGEAAADTQTALFADAVLNGLKSASLRANEDDKTNGWALFWNSLLSNSNAVRVAAPYAWQEDMFIQAETFCTNAFTNFPLHGTSGAIVNHALRYFLQVDPTPLTTGRVDLTLSIWPGEFGSTNASVFYTEVRKPDLW